MAVKAINKLIKVLIADFLFLIGLKLTILSAKVSGNEDMAKRLTNESLNPWLRDSAFRSQEIKR